MGSVGVMSISTEAPPRSTPRRAAPRCGTPRRATRSAVRLVGRPRRVLRAVHVVAGVGWVGLAAAMLSLGLTAALTSDAGLARTTYVLMELVGTRTIAAAAIATLVSGLVLGLVTPWGLVRHWWLVVKTALTLAVIVSAVGMTNGWVLRAGAAVGGDGTEAWWVVAGSVGHVALLVAATWISVDKPWGPTRRGRS